MASSLALTLTMAAATFVPPGEPVVDHSHPGHFAQPTLRRFEREPVDTMRRMAWGDFCNEIDKLWKEYRAAGSTEDAWREYKAAVQALRTNYVFQDPYYAPIPH